MFLQIKGSLRLDRALADRSRPLPAAARLRLAADVAAALAYLHNPGSGFIPTPHCDVRSANVLLDNCDGPKGRADARARLCDLGLAFMLQPAPAYADPMWQNVADANRRDTLSDVFALGVEMLELLTVQPAADPSRQQAILHLRLRDQLPAGTSETLLLADRCAGWGTLQSGVPAREFGAIAVHCAEPSAQDRADLNQVQPHYLDAFVIPNL